MLTTSAALLGKHVEIQPNCTWWHGFIKNAAQVLFGCYFARELCEAMGLGHLIYTGDGEVGVETVKWVVTTVTKDQ